MAISQTMDAGLDEKNPSSPTTESTSPPKAGHRKLIIIAVMAVLGICGFGAYATGLISRLFSGNEPHVVQAGSVELPEMVANLNAGAHRTAFVRLKARLVLSSKTDEAAVVAAEPRMKDLFLTYLRDMQPDELRGSAGTYRLREELISRANITLAPARVTEILFTELLIQ